MKKWRKHGRKFCTKCAEYRPGVLLRFFAIFSSMDEAILRESLRSGPNYEAGPIADDIGCRGESNGKLPLRTCPGCSVPEPYRSPDWALVPVKLVQGLNTDTTTTTNNNNNNNNRLQSAQQVTTGSSLNHKEANNCTKCHRIKNMRYPFHIYSVYKKSLD